MATILGTSQKNLEKSSQLIREGKLVIFPTNNVYSIGTNAFNEVNGYFDVTMNIKNINMPDSKDMEKGMTVYATSLN